MSNTNPKPKFYLIAFIILCCVCWPIFIYMGIIVPIVEMDWKASELGVQIPAFLVWMSLFCPFLIAPVGLPLLAFIFGRATNNVQDSLIRSLKK